MVFPCQTQEDDSLTSPLELLYAAYSCQRPVDLHSITKHYRSIDALIHSLPPKEQTTIYQSIYDIYSEKERLAFLAGLRAGFRLAEELAAPGLRAP